MAKRIFLCILNAISLAMACPAARGTEASAVTRLDGSTVATSQIDATVARLMEADHVPGAGIAVFNDGKIVYLKTYGLRDKEKRLPLTPDTIISAESLTKAAFATVAMQMVREQAINLDRPVNDYMYKPLPIYGYYKDLASDPRFEQITMRMLLDHTSGFPDRRTTARDGRLSINFEPGSRFSYSSEGFVLAQRTVEMAGKESVQVLMTDYLFDPLDMTNSSMVWKLSYEGGCANGYDEQGRSLGPDRQFRAGAAGSLQTTLHDYARFVQAVLDGKIPRGRAREEMLSAQMPVKSAQEFSSGPRTTATNDGVHLNYGLGWGLFWTPHGKAFFNEAHNGGFRHYVVCFDRPKSGLLIMTNSSNGEDMFSALQAEVLGDNFTPPEWEGDRPAMKP